MVVKGSKFYFVLNNMGKFIVLYNNIKKPTCNPLLRPWNLLKPTTSILLLGLGDTPPISGTYVTIHHEPQFILRMLGVPLPIPISQEIQTKSNHHHLCYLDPQLWYFLYLKTLCSILSDLELKWAASWNSYLCLCSLSAQWPLNCPPRVVNQTQEIQARPHWLIGSLKHATDPGAIYQKLMEILRMTTRTVSSHCSRLFTSNIQHSDPKASSNHSGVYDFYSLSLTAFNGLVGLNTPCTGSPSITPLFSQIAY